MDDLRNFSKSRAALEKAFAEVSRHLNFLFLACHVQLITCCGCGAFRLHSLTISVTNDLPFTLPVFVANCQGLQKLTDQLISHPDLRNRDAPIRETLWLAMIPKVV